MSGAHTGTGDALESAGVSGGREQPSSSPASSARIRAHEVGTAVRNGITLGGSLLLTWSVALIVKFQIPAHLGPSRVGHFGFAESFAGMFLAVTGLGIETYVVKEIAVRPAHASDFVGGVFALRALIFAVLLALMMVTLQVTGRTGEIIPTVAVFAATQFFLTLNQTLAAILQAASKVGRLAVSNVSGKLVWGVGLLIWLHANAPLPLLALPMLLGELLRLAILVPETRAAVGLRYRVDLASLRPVLVASLPYFISGVAISFGNNLSMTALEFIRRDEREVGWYAASQNLGSLAMLLCPLLVWVVMPMLSRAWARAPEEGMNIVRRSLEALIVIIAPATTILSCGADVFIRIAFGEKFAHAATGLSILSLVFLLFYLNILLGNALVIAGQAWWNTLISTCSIASMSVLMLVCVPAGRALMGTGGECAGAASAVILNEIGVVVAMVWRFPKAPFDARNVRVLAKSVAIAIVVLLTDRLLRGLGPARLVLDLGLYVALALMLRLVHAGDVRKLVEVVRARRAGNEPAVT
ncbi:MAG: oligosaccharide flippase family protein [Polyangiaceae bacterium]